MLNPVLKLCVALLLSVACGALHAQQDGELWEMSMSVGEDNGPLMPVMNNKVCSPKSKNAGEQMMKPDDDSNCKTDLKTSGNKSRFKTVCVKNGETTTMEGVQEHLGPDHFKSDATVTIENRKGKQVMRQAMTMKKVGACKVEDPTAGVTAEMKKMCGEMVESMHEPSFLGKDALCKELKPQFCARVKTVAEESRDPAKYQIRNIQRPDEVSKACGIDLAGVTRSACQRAVDTRNWNFLNDHCPAQAKEIAAAHCAGRSYTAMMQSEYSQICRAQSPDIARHEAARDKAEAAGAAPTDTAPKKKDKNLLDKGKDMLKSLF